MFRNSLWKIFGTMVMSITILLIIVFIAPPLPNQKDNGFSRIWLNNAVIPLKNQPTSIPIEDICGATDTSIFFSTNNPRCIIKQNYNLEKFDSIFFPVQLTKKVLSNKRLVIDFPWSYLFISNQPGFIYGKLNDSAVTDPHFTKTKQLFIQSAVVSPEAAVIRTFDSLQTKQIFQKISSPTGEVLAEKTLIDDQADRGFSSGGILRFDNNENVLVYVQYYQNSFFILDTNLSLQHHFHTIDTTFTNNTRMEQTIVDGMDKIVPTKARVTINKNAFASKGLLYVVSGLRADNETIRVFNDNSVIDLYTIKNGKYMGSFYLPNRDHGKIRSLFIKNDKMIVLYNKSIAIYSLSLPAIQPLSTLNSFQPVKVVF